MTGSGPKLVERKLVYKGRAFCVYEYTVDIGGQVLKRDVIERAHGVVVVAIDGCGNVLLINEYCAGPNSMVLSLPGGSLDEGELPEEGARRELREETGYQARTLVKMHYAFGHPGTSSRRSHTFLAHGLSWSPLPNSDEIIKLVRMPLEEAIKAVYKDFASDVSTIGNLLMARDKLRQLGLGPP